MNAHERNVAVPKLQLGRVRHPRGPMDGSFAARAVSQAAEASVSEPLNGGVGRGVGVRMAPRLCRLRSVNLVIPDIVSGKIGGRDVLPESDPL